MLNACFVSLSSLFIHTKRKWARFDMRGNFVDRFDAGVDNDWEILCNAKENISVQKKLNFPAKLD